MMFHDVVITRNTQCYTKKKKNVYKIHFTKNEIVLKKTYIYIYICTRPVVFADIITCVIIIINTRIILYGYNDFVDINVIF